jgi:hypothetical protein
MSSLRESILSYRALSILAFRSLGIDLPSRLGIFLVSGSSRKDGSFARESAVSVLCHSESTRCAGADRGTIPRSPLPVVCVFLGERWWWLSDSLAHPF